MTMAKLAAELVVRYTMSFSDKVFWTGTTVEWLGDFAQRK